MTIIRYIRHLRWGALALAALPLALRVAAAPPVLAAGGEAGSAIAGSIASIALSQVRVGDTPAAASFRGVDCDPYSTLVGAQSPNADGCGRDGHVGIVTAVRPGGTVDLVNGDFLGATNIGVQRVTGISLTSWASHVWRPGEQWVLVRPPAGRQQAVPAVAATGPAEAVAGTSASFRASASGRIATYRWTFGDGRGANVSGAPVSHVYAEDGFSGAAALRPRRDPPAEPGRPA